MSSGSKKGTQKYCPFLSNSPSKQIPSTHDRKGTSNVDVVKTYVTKYIKNLISMEFYVDMKYVRTYKGRSSQTGTFNFTGIKKRC
jgi:hypothetical protein